MGGLIGFAIPFVLVLIALVFFVVATLAKGLHGMVG